MTIIIIIDEMNILQMNFKFVIWFFGVRRRERHILFPLTPASKTPAISFGKCVCVCVVYYRYTICISLCVSLSLENLLFVRIPLRSIIISLHTSIIFARQLGTTVLIYVFFYSVVYGYGGRRS